jgi:hypothetical protein
LRLHCCPVGRAEPQPRPRHLDPSPWLQIMYDHPGMYCGGTVNGALVIPEGLEGSEVVVGPLGTQGLTLGIKEVIFNDVALGACGMCVWLRAPFVCMRAMNGGAWGGVGGGEGGL